VRTADPAKAQRIIDAAIQLFAERPYHEVRMDDIAERAKVAKGTLYLHFKDKEALYQALMLEGLKGLATRLEECLKALVTPEEKLLMLNRESIRYLERYRFFLDLFQRDEVVRIGGISQAFQDTKARLNGIVASVLHEFPSKDQSSAAEIELEVLAMSGMMKEIVHNLPRPWPLDLAERITGLFLNGLRRHAGADNAQGRKPARRR
jgi:AcrR family transcriptional regulator